MNRPQKPSIQSYLCFRAAPPILLGFALAAVVAAAAQTPAPDSPALEAKARALVAKLTLEQKIELLGGIDGMFTCAIPAIGLPRFKMSDGPVGVRTWGPATAYPGGAALAASWDPALARRVGEGLGRDARARGVNFLLGPGVNIARSPVAGRNFEYFSEDPFLNAGIVVGYIEGVQSQGVIATVKHYALNNQEYNRLNASSDVDERTMREIYLPSFEAAVTQAHVDAVMNSYNLVNGVHATQSEFLNLKVLKGDWGFQGILMSDWDATHDGVAAANNGLDLEMPSPRFMNARVLLPAIKSGLVKESTIDDKVLRLLRAALRYGFLDRPQLDPAASTYSVADRAVALDGAMESLTLLKNEGRLLPLDPARVKTIAVIGPDAYPAVTTGGGSAETQAFEPVSILTGIANLLGPDAHVLYSRGLPEMIDLFQNTRWVGDVKVSTYPSRDFTGKPEAITLPNIAEINENSRQLDPSSPASIRYTASYKAEKAGKYLILAFTHVWENGAYKVTIDGKEVLAHPAIEGQVPQSATIDLNAGQIVSVVAEYQPNSSIVHFGLAIAYEPELIAAEVKTFAADADVVVVAAGFDLANEREGSDRSFSLPWGQDLLIDAVAQANPRTIVTLIGGGAVDTRPWLGKIPALLEAWYPGQEGGTAIAEVLFGKHNPEGKLPVSFDRSWEESPSYPWYYPVKGADTSLHVIENDKPPVDDLIQHVKYGDKLMVGYRYWTTTGKHPLFPFGFGLNYTTFNFANLQVPAKAASGSTVPVSFDVTNAGSVAGAEVAQLYVSDPSAKVSRPERELKGFEKVLLAPGETKRITLNLDARAFSYWDEAAHKWAIDPGKFVIRVGDSSENTPLSAELTLN
ncbi:MAG: glycoside hydrolase family 3 C-terminal domain-containing protein [Terracidiphilus sp.]|jgi:beta-glucosidase